MMPQQSNLDHLVSSLYCTKTGSTNIIQIQGNYLGTVKEITPVLVL